MSKYAIHDTELHYVNRTISVPAGWRIVFEYDDDNTVQEDDMLLTMGTVFISVPDLRKTYNIDEVGDKVSEKICVIRRIVNDIKTKKYAEQVIKRLNPKEFINELQRLHS